jgi:anionic cell wall polymer biosynthesis LytR-Cps2A-Psr (LCP) family protein
VQNKEIHDSLYTFQMKHPPIPLVIFAVVFSVSFLFTVLIISEQYKRASHSIATLTNQGPTITPIPTIDPLRPKNILILGYGGANHDGGSLTDTIIVLHIVPKDKKVFLITVPRDLWVSFPVDEEHLSSYKINAAYAIGVDSKNYPHKLPEYSGDDGGRKLASYVIEQTLGLPIDHVIAVSFSGFTQTLKNIEPLFVNVPESFTDIYYPIEGKKSDTCGKTEEEIQATTATMSGFLLEQAFPCRYETISYTKGMQELSAEEALKFVRSRHSTTGGGDFNRSVRQSALIDAIKSKLTNPTILTKLPSLAKGLIASIDTDISLTHVPELLGLYHDFGTYTLSTISINDKNVLNQASGPQGQFILVPKNNNAELLKTFVTQSIESSPSANRQ